jgi:TRAP-type mannitol/chloroaromatic compound transport system permease small subunit
MWQPRTQAKVDLVLYFLFFFPGVIALIIAGWKYAERSWAYGETSVNSPAGVPIYQFKTVIVAAGILLFIQGVAQVCRCILAMRINEWMPAEEDVFETEDLLMSQASKAEKDSHP